MVTSSIPPPSPRPASGSGSTPISNLTESRRQHLDARQEKDDSLTLVKGRTEIIPSPFSKTLLYIGEPSTTGEFKL